MNEIRKSATFRPMSGGIVINQADKKVFVGDHELDRLDNFIRQYKRKRRAGRTIRNQRIDEKAA